MMRKGRAFVGLLVGVPVAASSASAAAAVPRDPWEGFNRSVFAFNETIDEYLLRPVAQAYLDYTPTPVSRSVTNFFNNLRDVPTLANQLLQLKHYEAAATSSRIVFNTFFGIGGLIDVGTAWDLPIVREDFGQTLCFYGADQGPYLMLPFLGPSTVTEAIGRIPDRFVDPLTYVDEPYTYAVTGVKAVDIRAGVIPAENLIIGDRYTFVRNAYLQSRDFQINGQTVTEDPFLDDEDLDDF